MDYEADERNILEHMLLDDTAAPSYLPFSLLKEITNNFSPDQQIGCGGFATVYKAKGNLWLQGQLWSGSVAVKKLHNTNLTIREDKYITELECLTKVKHKNIVRFLGYCSEVHGRMLDCCGSGDLNMAEEWQRLLCFEYLPNGSLDMHINACSGRLEWRECYQIIKGICEGLYYVHEKSILHLDLKPNNILLDYNMVPKIADFGLARWFGENQMRDITENIVGTIGYMAPEYLSDGVMTDKSDIYSLGVMIMVILTGDKKYCTIENHGEAACAFVLESWKNRLESSLSKDTALAQIRACAEISAACMDPDPKNRPCALDILAKLDEMETSDRFGENIESTMWIAQGIIPHPAGLLNVKPLELKFRNQMGNFRPCQVYLANKTDQHVAFRLMPSDRKRECCSLEHLVYGGVVPPRSTCTLNLRTHKIEKASSWKEEYLLQSRIMRNVMDFKDLRGQVHEVTMRADYILERQKLLTVVLKVAVTRNSCKVSILRDISVVQGIEKLEYDNDKSTLTVVGFVDVAEVVAALRKSKHPAEVRSLTSNNTDAGVEKDDAGPSRA